MIQLFQNPTGSSRHAYSICVALAVRRFAAHLQWTGGGARRQTTGIDSLKAQKQDAILSKGMFNIILVLNLHVRMQRFRTSYSSRQSLSGARRLESSHSVSHDPAFFVCTRRPMDIQDLFCSTMALHLNLAFPLQQGPWDRWRVVDRKKRTDRHRMVCSVRCCQRDRILRFVS